MSITEVTTFIATYVVADANARVSVSDVYAFYQTMHAKGRNTLYKAMRERTGVAIGAKYYVGYRLAMPAAVAMPIIINDGLTAFERAQLELAAKKAEEEKADREAKLALKAKKHADELELATKKVEAEKAAREAKLALKAKLTQDKINAANARCYAKLAQAREQQVKVDNLDDMSQLVAGIVKLMKTFNVVNESNEQVVELGLEKFVEDIQGRIKHANDAPMEVGQVFGIVPPARSEDENETMFEDKTDLIRPCNNARIGPDLKSIIIDCFTCERMINLEHKGYVRARDVAVVCGNSRDLDNLYLCCSQCNQTMGTMSVVDYKHKLYEDSLALLTPEQLQEADTRRARIRKALNDYDSESSA